jgi:DNA ligase-1
MILPKLFKKTSTGSIQFWEISVKDNVIHKTYGLVGTTSPQTTSDEIKTGKNAGKTNETTKEQQAELEAKADWEKHLKKGYVQTIADAQNNKTDACIEGGVLPMLAHKFSEQGHKITYPCYTQPKLDGMRCCAILINGTCTLWSRTRKPITSVPHIIKAVEQRFKGKNKILDGELYNHKYKNDFEKILHFARQEVPEKGHEIVQFHIYDVVDLDKHFEDRLIDLQGFVLSDPLIPVRTEKCDKEDELMEWFETFRRDGYEGCMARNAKGKYVNKRSYDLQKIKEFEDSEFEIVGIEEGRGRLQKHAASFICKTDTGTFKAKLTGELSKLKQYFDNHSLWQGKKLTVKYQGLTAYGIPRFPIGLCVRDYE